MRHTVESLAFQASETEFDSPIRYQIRGHIAQWIEQQSSKLRCYGFDSCYGRQCVFDVNGSISVFHTESAGSNPVRRSNLIVSEKTLEHFLQQGRSTPLMDMESGTETITVVWYSGYHVSLSR